MSTAYTDALKATRASFIADWEEIPNKPAHYQETLDRMDRKIEAQLMPKHTIKASYLESRIQSAYKTMKLTCSLDTDQQKRIWKILTELKNEL